MKDELGGQFMKEVVGLRVKIYTRFFFKKKHVFQRGLNVS